MSKLDNVELNKLEKKKIIITNTIKMLNIRINNIIMHCLKKNIYVALRFTLSRG